MFHQSIKPINPPAAWLGGKSKLAERLIAVIEFIPHDTYAEVFLGMGGVFFRRQLVPQHEVINDKQHDVYNFFRVVQRHYAEFLKVLRYQTNSRHAFKDWHSMPPECLTDIERAARFYYLQKTAFGGKCAGQAYGVDKDRTRFNIRKVRKYIEQLHERMCDVSVECLNYDRFIEIYDGPHTLFYLDPPYWGGEDDYGKNLFERGDFERIAELLKSIKGKFLLSINDVPEIREIFAGFHIHDVKTKYTISGGEAQDVTELVITNVDLGRNVKCLARC